MPVDENKFFVGGLAPETTTESLRSHFEPIGPLTDCIVMTDARGISRCFGFVAFESRQSYETVLQIINDETDNIEVDGQVVKVKEVDGKGRKPMRAPASNERESRGLRPSNLAGGRSERGGRSPSRERRGGGQQILPRDCRKLFLGGLSFDAGNGEIEEAFAGFGEITDAVAMTDRDGKPRGFGFVTFAKPYMAAKAYNHDIFIDGRQLQMKPADGMDGPKGEIGMPNQRSQLDSRRGAPLLGATVAPMPDKRFDVEDNKVYVRDLPSTVNDDRLRLLFSEFGNVVDASAQTDRGAGFVTFSSPSGPVKAVNRGSLNIDGVVVTIQHYSRDKTKRSGGIGGSGGGNPAAAPFRARSREVRRGERSSPPPRRRERSPRGAPGEFKTGGKIFVGGLSYETSDSGLRNYFEQFGEIVDHVVMMKNGSPRGFGFVTFADELVAQDVLQQPHNLDGKELQLKEADGDRPGKREKPAPDANKLFIGGLHHTTKTEDLEQVFGQFGTLNDAIALRERGFGYVRFDDPEVARQVLQNPEIEIGGRMVNIKPCADPPREPPPKRERH